MDDLDQLVVIITVFQLFIDISQVIEIEFSFSLDVQDPEISSASLFAEWASLNNNFYTILAVSYLMNC